MDVIKKYLGATSNGAGCIYLSLLCNINNLPLALTLEGQKLETPLAHTGVTPMTTTRIFVYNVCSVNVPGSNNCLNTEFVLTHTGNLS